VSRSKKNTALVWFAMALGVAMFLTIGGCERDFDPLAPIVSEQKPAEPYDEESEFLEPPEGYMESLMPQRSIGSVPGAPTTAREMVEQARDLVMSAWDQENGYFICSSTELTSSFGDICWNFTYVYSFDTSVNAGFVASIGLTNNVRWFDEQTPCRQENGASHVSCGSMNPPAHDFVDAYNPDCPYGREYWENLFNMLLNEVTLQEYWNSQSMGWNQLRVGYGGLTADGEYVYEFAYDYPIDTVPSFYCGAPGPPPPPPPPPRPGKGDLLPDIREELDQETIDRDRLDNPQGGRGGVYPPDLGGVEPPPPPSIIIVSDDFETGDFSSNWGDTSAGSSRVYVSSEFGANTGSFAAVFDRDTAGTTILSYKDLNADLSTHDDVYISFWARTNSSNGNQAIYFKDGDGDFSYAYELSTATLGTNTWTFVSLDVDAIVATMPSIQMDAGFEFGFHGQPNDQFPASGLMIDDVTVGTGPPPTQ